MSDKIKIILVVVLGAVLTFTAWLNHRWEGTVSGRHWWERQPAVVEFKQGMTSFPGQSATGLLVLQLPEAPPSNSVPAKEGIRYTAVVGSIHSPLFVATNVLEIVQHTPECKLIRYVDSQGNTGEFHAWLVEVIVKTNR
jgi:hypothetical protein